jgi:pimeloyl-ACP methyl ester carboxylesterase
VVAASFGGLIAIDYAVRRPGRIGSLALLSPAGVAPVRAKYLLTAVPLFFFGAWGRRRTIELVFGLPPEERTPETGSFLQSCERVLEHHRIRTQPLPTFTDAQLRGLTMPVLAIIGRRDIVFSAATVRRRLAANVPGARIIELPNAGHGLTDPTLAVHEFLQH